MVWLGRRAGISTTAAIIVDTCFVPPPRESLQTLWNFFLGGKSSSRYTVPLPGFMMPFGFMALLILSNRSSSTWRLVRRGFPLGEESRRIGSLGLCEIEVEIAIAHVTEGNGTDARDESFGRGPPPGLLAETSAWARHTGCSSNGGRGEASGWPRTVGYVVDRGPRGHSSPLNGRAGRPEQGTAPTRKRGALRCCRWLESGNNHPVSAGASVKAVLGAYREVDRGKFIGQVTVRGNLDHN